MSDTLADLASWLPSEIHAGDAMDKEKFFNTRNKINRNALCFPSEFPYEFGSSSSTESESDDDDIAGLTRRFSRSASLQEPRGIPYCLEKQRVFSGSPQSTLNWSVSGPSAQVRSPSSPQFRQAEADAWDLIYAAAGEVARMKMRMRINNDMVAGKNNRGLLGSPLSLQHHPHCSIWGMTEREELLFRQQQFCQRASGGANYGGGGGGRPLGLTRSAWPTPHVQNQRHQQPCNGLVTKPVLVGCSSAAAGGAAAVKRECAGTGVFLPRRYCNNPPEPKKKPACSPANLPARVVQSSKRNLDPITAQAQPNINGGFVPHYEMLMARRNAVILAQHRRSNSHGGPPVAPPVAHPEVLLPQEWTY